MELDEKSLLEGILSVERVRRKAEEEGRGGMVGALSENLRLLLQIQRHFPQAQRGRRQSTTVGGGATFTQPQHCPLHIFFAGPQIPHCQRCFGAL